MKLTVLTAAAFCVATSAAFAKGHDQGNTTVPGADDVGSVTVSSAQSLGGVIGERPAEQGPSTDNPASGNAGH